MAYWNQLLSLDWIEYVEGSQTVLQMLENEPDKAQTMAIDVKIRDPILKSAPLKRESNLRRRNHAVRT